jgi:hypothetical protein
MRAPHVLKLLRDPSLVDGSFWEAAEDFFLVRVGATEKNVAVPGDGWS